MELLIHSIKTYSNVNLLKQQSIPLLSLLIKGRKIMSYGDSCGGFALLIILFILLIIIGCSCWGGGFGY
ncbi:hypothetical protein M2E15_2732 [Bacillus mycoides]|nr:hypothetical protein M2E15_2732 [Bacillus mycoides]